MNIHQKCDDLIKKNFKLRNAISRFLNFGDIKVLEDALDDFDNNRVSVSIKGENNNLEANYND